MQILIRFAYTFATWFVDKIDFVFLSSIFLFGNGFPKSQYFTLYSAYVRFPPVTASVDFLPNLFSICKHAVYDFEPSLKSLTIPQGFTQIHLGAIHQRRPFESKGGVGRPMWTTSDRGGNRPSTGCPKTKKHLQFLSVSESDTPHPTPRTWVSGSQPILRTSLDGGRGVFQMDNVERGGV